jgi:hypothetical protein
LGPKSSIVPSRITSTWRRHLDQCVGVPGKDDDGAALPRRLDALREHLLPHQIDMRGRLVERQQHSGSP